MVLFRIGEVHISNLCKRTALKILLKANNEGPCKDKIILRGSFAIFCSSSCTVLKATREIPSLRIRSIDMKTPKMLHISQNGVIFTFAYVTVYIHPIKIILRVSAIPPALFTSSFSSLTAQFESEFVSSPASFLKEERKNGLTHGYEMWLISSKKPFQISLNRYLIII